MSDEAGKGAPSTRKSARLFVPKKRMDIDELRMPKERKLLDRITNMPAFPDLEESWDQHLQQHDPRRNYLAGGLRLSAAMSPKIFRLKECIQKILKTDVSFDLYVYGDPNMNASCIRTGDSEFIVAMTSSLVEKMGSRELLFVLGHEIGHTMLEHDIIPGANFALMEREGKRPNVALGLYLLAWQRYAEISADRVGLLCCQDYMSAGKSFVKMASGLTERHIGFDIEEYASQLSDFECAQTETGAQSDWFHTHPLSPFRVRALYLFSKSDLFADYFPETCKSDCSIGEVNSQVGSMLANMDPDYIEDTSSLAQCIRNFILWAAIDIAAADQTVDAVELQAIADIVGDAAVKKAVNVIKKGKARPDSEISQAALRIAAEASMERRLRILSDLITVAMADMNLAPEEINVLVQIGQTLEIPVEAFKKLLQPWLISKPRPARRKAPLRRRFRK
ncbi:MAG: M48 family metallopeptidase [Planctomycetota bacterium]|jgi:uncharacterized tellurite resistance protein B-like protein